MLESGLLMCESVDFFLKAISKTLKKDSGFHLATLTFCSPKFVDLLAQIRHY